MWVPAGHVWRLRQPPRDRWALSRQCANIRYFGSGAFIPEPARVSVAQSPAAGSVRWVSEAHSQLKADFEQERAQLLRQIDELTVGGEIELDFDDDFADRGQVASEQGEYHALADTLQAQLRLVEQALERIEQGTYGLCEKCGEPIGDARLEALPATSRCIEHA